MQTRQQAQPKAAASSGSNIRAFPQRGAHLSPLPTHTCSADMRPWVLGSPATVAQATWCSHQGSTHGGCVCNHGALGQTSGAVVDGVAVCQSLDQALAADAPSQACDCARLLRTPGQPIVGSWSLDRRGRQSCAHCPLGSICSIPSQQPLCHTPTLDLHTEGAPGREKAATLGSSPGRSTGGLGSLGLGWLWGSCTLGTPVGRWVQAEGEPRAGQGLGRRLPKAPGLPRMSREKEARTPTP